MREIVLDTETTGLDPSQGHRIVEIGCLELKNRTPTGSCYHAYLNPQRDVPEESRRITNLSTEFLADKPLFADVADGFLEFIADSPLVIHNAEFDLKFLNSELGKIEKPALLASRAVDTLMIARRKYPGSPASLDALCRKFSINLDDRKAKGHGAMLDVELLAQVYLELLGGRQQGLELLTQPNVPAGGAAARTALPARPSPLAPRLREQELKVHAAMVVGLGKDSIWRS